jgi:hypothetical protein
MGSASDLVSAAKAVERVRSRAASLPRMCNKGVASWRFGRQASVVGLAMETICALCHLGANLGVMDMGKWEVIGIAGFAWALCPLLATLFKGPAGGIRKEGKEVWEANGRPLLVVWLAWSQYALGMKCFSSTCLAILFLERSSISLFTDLAQSLAKRMNDC